MSVQIVCLDGYTLNPGDIGWGPFEAIGQLTVHDRTPDNQIVQRATVAPHVLTNKTPLSAETIASLPEMKYVGVLATGYNIVDLEAVGQRGIVVTNIPTYGTDSVAQHSAAIMLELTRHTAAHNKAVHEGQWSRCPDFCFALAPITELTGQTLGIVGLGRIGMALAKIAQAMGMRLVAHDAVQLSAEQLDGLPVQYIELDELFKQADVISLHCPLTPQTDRLVNAKRLATMKPTAVLINTSRGPLIDHGALAKALVDRTIAGAALDVLETEPPPTDNPLFEAPNCIITPHIAWYATAARQRLMQIAADNLNAFLDGQPANVVN